MLPDEAPTVPAIRPVALRVPAITAYFWLAKGLSTALGESTSDYLVRVLGPVPAVGLGFVAFVAALVLQFTKRRYVAWAYWFAVVMVGIFGTMVADVLHVGFGVPYAVSTVACAVLLAGVYLSWHRSERTLSIHSVATARREAFYWAAVVATFALGTAAGDLTATTLNLGYAGSLALFAVLILVPAVGYRWLRWNSILTFWFAYVVTRPLGASVADWLGKPRSAGGLDVGDGLVSLVLAVSIIGIVGYLTVTRRDVPTVGTRRHRPTTAPTLTTAEQRRTGRHPNGEGVLGLGVPADPRRGQVGRLQQAGRAGHRGGGRAVPDQGWSGPGT